MNELLERAWGIIANAGGGNWNLETQEWQYAAAQWRESYHEWLKTRPTGGFLFPCGIPPDAKAALLKTLAEDKGVGRVEVLPDEIRVWGVGPPKDPDAVGEITAALGGVEVPPILAGLIESNYAEFHAARQGWHDAGGTTPGLPSEPDASHVVGGGT